MPLVSKRVTFFCSIEKVWEKVTNLNDCTWRSDLKGIKIIDANHFVEISKDGIATNFPLAK